jgi:hypothetical protein
MIKDLFSFLGVVATEEEEEEERDDGEEKKKKKKTNEPRFVTTHYGRLFRFEATPLSGDLFWFFQQNVKKQKNKTTKMHLGGIGMTSDRQTENGRTSSSGNVTRCVCYFSSAKPTTKEEKPISFVLLFSQSLCLM